jgi:hypothetical protein
MSELKRFLIISTFLVLLGSVGFAQQTSSVTGIVTDSTGAAIAGADVKLTNKTGA